MKVTNGQLRRGQTAVEYVLVSLVLTIVALMLVGFIWVVQGHAGRTRALVTSDCP